MPKNDNPHALRLYQAVCDVKDAAHADRIAEVLPLSKGADVSRKHRWAHDCCAYLSNTCSPDDALQIRRTCRCNDGKTMAREIDSCIRKAGTLQDGCSLFTRQNKYAFLEYVSGHELRFGYHTCVCSCIKRSEEYVPVLWCECSAGYALSMFRMLFGDSVQVHLLSSVKSGAERCEIKITWQ